MTMTNKKRRAGQQGHASRGAFQISPVAAACSALLLATGVAYAQSEPAKEADKKEEVQTVTVTGIRRGIEGAISLKKNSDNIVEGVSAEDIGKLPDVSIAESIARLPGLAAQRAAGRAQVISVRGLSPDFATTLLNGRELVSTGDNRSVEFDQYPSELLNSVLVYKTPDAGLIGQGLSGTIDMQTQRPLDFGSRVLSVGARYSQNSLGSAAGSSGDGNRFSVSYIDQFADRTVGLVLGYAHQETPVQEEQTGLYEPWQVAPRSGVPADTYVTDGLKALRRTGRTQRDAVMGTLEWRPSKSWTSVLDVFHSDAKQEDTANQFEMHLYYNGAYPCNPSCDWSNVTVNDNGTLIGGTITNVYPLVRGMYNKREDTIDAAGWNNRFTFGDVKLLTDISYSKATRDELSLENNTQLVPAPQYDTVNVNFNPGGFAQINPSLDYSNPDALLLRGTIYGSGYGKVPHVEDELASFKLATTMPAPAAVAGFLSELQFGINYADRSKTKRQPEGSISVGAQGDTAVESDLQRGSVDLSFAGLGNIPAWNVPGAVARYMVFAPDDQANYLISKAWQVDEKTTTAYAKSIIDTEFGAVHVGGNFGLQFQSVNQSSDANYFDGTAPVGSQVKPIHDGKTVTDVLPSLNLNFDLGSGHTVRFAVARQVARPRVDQLRAALEFGIDQGTGKPGASGGNARLDPWRANAVDISYEKYFGTRAYVAAAAYYKDLRTYIYTQTNQNYDFSKFVAGYTPPPGSPPAQTTGSYTAPYNGKGGNLSGLELTASLPLNMVAPWFRGFGVVASASFNDSNIKIVDPDSASSVGSGEIDLPGLSKRVYNLTAYYEAGGFEARVSQRRRSDFIGEIGNFSGNRTLRYVKGENIIDAQLGYNFQEGMFKGLSVLLQANNLNDASYQTYAGSPDRPLENIKWGTTYLLGINYKL